MFICNSFFNSNFKIAATNRWWGKEMIRGQICIIISLIRSSLLVDFAYFFHWINDTLIHNVIL